MLNPQQSALHRLAVVAGMSFFAVLAATQNALARQTMPEGELEPALPIDPATGSSGTNGQPATFEASAGGFDWGTAGLAFAVGLAVLASASPCSTRPTDVAGASPPAEPIRNLRIRKENTMLHPDTETQRQLVRERHAELKRDWQASDAASPAVQTRHPRSQWLGLVISRAAHQVQRLPRLRMNHPIT